MNIRVFTIYPFAILAIIFSSIFAVKILGITINITPSMKEGIYIRTYGSIKRGDIVAACLTEPYKTIGLKNLYIKKGTKCDGADPVVKEVIAIPGDDVELTGDHISVNKVMLPFKTLYRDSNGRILDTYPRGQYFPTVGYWLIGTNSPKSWDSRYWGTIKKDQILYRLVPWLTFLSR